MNPNKERKSAKLSRSRTCVVSGCSNGDYQLSLWKSKVCNLHGVTHQQPPCDCKPPFK